MTAPSSSQCNLKRSRNSIVRSAVLHFLVGAVALHQPASAFVHQHQPSSLSAVSQRTSSLHAATSASDGGALLPPDLEQALERKNASRLKFGLAPITAPQFLELQTQVEQMEKEHVLKAEALQQIKPQPKSNASNLGNFAKTLFSKSLENTCYSNFDCASPQVCCDLGIKKMCCSNGMMQVQHEYAYVPVPVDMRK
jgi:hypothetical protein